MRDVLIICPSERDLCAVAAAGLERRYRVRAVGADVDGADAFDPAGVVAEAEAVPSLDGVLGSKDRTALLASIVAARRSLPGPAPAAVLRCQHKPSSRAVQAGAAPEAVPRHAALLDGRLPFTPPFFAKPVVGRLSQGVRVVRGADDLPAHGLDAYAASYERIAALASLDALCFDGFIAEGLVSGLEVTLEGYVHAGAVTVIGITDSVHYPGTGSFQRFEYPTRLGPARRHELAELTRRVVPALGLEDCFFNVELSVPAAGPARIIEVNPRIASQFAPLVLAAHGRSSYDALFALACGEDPGWSAGDADGVAVSWVIRVFDDALVEAVPEPEPGVELLVGAGLRLSEQGLNDTASFRLAIFSEHAETREQALDRCRRRAEALLRGFVLRRDGAYTVSRGT